MEPDLIDSNTVFKSVIQTSDPANVRMLTRENHVYVCSPAGGPILYYPDPTRVVSGARKGVNIAVADGRGNFITEFELSDLEPGDNIFRAGWLDTYQIVVVTRKRYIQVYTTDGTLLATDDTFSTAKLRQGSPVLTEAKFFGLGAVMIIGLEVVKPDTHEKIRRSYVVTAVFNPKTNHIDLAKKMFMYTSSVVVQYQKYQHALYAILLDENSRVHAVENLFTYFRSPTAPPSAFSFSDETKRPLEMLTCQFSYSGTRLIALQKNSQTQVFEINVFDFVVNRRPSQAANQGDKTEAGGYEFVFELAYAYDFDQSAHLGSSNKLFWINDDIFGAEIYNNVFQIHAISTQSDEYLIDTIDHVYALNQECDGVRFHCVEDENGEKHYSNVLFCPYDEDLRKLSSETPAAYLWKSFIKPEDTSFVNKFSEHVYESIETVCKAALFLPKSDQRRIQLMRCASYGLMLASPEDAKRGSPFMQTIVKLLRLLHTMNNSGCMMTYKQFYELAAVERGRIKDPLHKHGKGCAEFYRHPVQCILVSLNLFSLCNAWTTECDMSTEALEEQWCYRKARRICCNIDNDIARLKQHMSKLSQASLLRVINVCLKKPQLELLCEVASISNVTRDVIIRNLPATLSQNEQSKYMTYLAKICIAYSDYQSFYSLLEKVLAKEGTIDMKDLHLIREINDTPCSTLLQSASENTDIMKFCSRFDTLIQQASYSMLQRWSDQYILFRSALEEQRISRDQLHTISNSLLKCEGPQKYLQRVYIDDATWMWEIHGDTKYREVAERMMKSSRQISGVETDSFYQQSMSFFRGFELDKKEVERSVSAFKQSMGVDDKIILRAQIAVIDEISNAEEKTARLEQFASVKKLDAFASELLAFSANSAGLKDIRNKFLKAFDSQKTKKLDLLLKMKDEQAAWDLIKSERDRSFQMQLCNAMILSGVQTSDIKVNVESLLKQLKSSNQ